MIKGSLKIAFTAVFVALAVVCKMYGVPIAGFSSQVSFAYIPVIMSGTFLGPIAGCITGALADIIGTVIRGFSMNPLITLSNALMGLIPGLVFLIPKLNHYIKLVISLLLVYLGCTLGMSTLATFLYYNSAKQTFPVYWTARFISQSPIFALNAGILIVLYPVLKKLIFDKYINTNDKRTIYEPPAFEEEEEITDIENGKNDDYFNIEVK